MESSQWASSLLLHHLPTSHVSLCFLVPPPPPPSSPSPPPSPPSLLFPPSLPPHPTSPPAPLICETFWYIHYIVRVRACSYCTSLSQSLQDAPTRSPSQTVAPDISKIHFAAGSNVLGLRGQAPFRPSPSSPTLPPLKPPKLPSCRSLKTLRPHASKV